MEWLAEWLEILFQREANVVLRMYKTLKPDIEYYVQI